MLLSVLILLSFLPVTGYGQVQTQFGDYTDTGTYTEQEYITYQLEVSSRVLNEISDLFTTFSEADMEANKAMAKVDLISHEYQKAMNVIPKEGEKLHELMKSLLSHVEIYLNYFRNTNRENPEINFQIVEIKRKVNEEMIRLHYLAE